MHKIYHTSAYVKINSCAAPGRRFLNFTSADNLILFCICSNKLIIKYFNVIKSCFFKLFMLIS